MTFPSYSTGTVTVAANGTTVTGSGTVWSDVNARAGDLLQIGNFQTIISEVTDPTNLVIPTWGGGAQTSAAYVIWHTSPLRFAGGQAMADVSALVAALNTDGFYVFVPSTATDPDPSYGNDGQYAFQASTGKLWIKSGGVWTFLGIYKAFGLAAPWSSLTAYEVNDVATLAGSSYVCILAHTNHTPPNATYWAVLAAKGDTGATGSTGAAGTNGTNGAGYGGTSTTSLLIGTGSKAFTTQAGLAYVVGSRVRAASNANGANYMEGLVTAYSGTTLTVNVGRVGGSGTLADWNLSIAGDPGSGDLLSSNNLSDVANPATALGNLNGVSYGASQSLTATQQSQARANMAVPGKNRIINGRFQRDVRNAGAPTSVADNAYFADRWRYIGEASATCAARQTNFGTNRFCGSVQVSGTTNKGGTFQVIEGINCKDLQSKAIVVSSVLAAAASIGDVRMGILQFTGTEDATTGDPVSAWNAAGTNPTLATNWSFVNTPANLSVTLTPTAFSVTGTVSSSANNLAVLIWSEDKSYTAADGIYFTEVQLEEGSIASPYEFVPTALLNSQCARYYRIGGGAFAAAYVANVAHITYDFSGNPMRIVPVGSILVGLNAVIIPGVAAITVTGITGFSGSADGGILQVSYSNANTGAGYSSAGSFAFNAEI